ncbi:MAG: MBL fold metallo-hydrolase, partial [Candidatus Eremiobacteraeota bacterium]|nr:MBL fold metallo-hydrolase [Candidatus Eremiobacteraeota bacterium]
MQDSVVVEHLTVGPLGCTCTIVADMAAGEAIVVDGGDEAARIVERLDALGVRATYLVHTHAHFDHIGALGELRERTGGRGLLHAGDLPLYALLAEQARFFGVPVPAIVPLDGHLRDGDVVRAGAAALAVLHTPGHTPGRVSFALNGDRRTLFTGDTLFRGAVGRTDIGGTTLEEL